MGQYCGRNYFPLDFFGVDSATKKIGSSLKRLDLIFERIGRLFHAQRLTNEYDVKQTPSGGNGNFVTSNTEKAHHCEIQIEWVANLLVCT